MSRHEREVVPVSRHERETVTTSHYDDFALRGRPSISMTFHYDKTFLTRSPRHIPYSDVGTDNCTNTSLSSDSENLKLSKCYNHVNLNGRTQELTS